MDYFEFIQHPSSYLCDFELGYCWIDHYQSRIIPPSPTESWALKGYISTIASIDMQHYNSWVAPHFTQPNGLTRSTLGIQAGELPLIFLVQVLWETRIRVDWKSEWAACIGLHCCKAFHEICLIDNLHSLRIHRHPTSFYFHLCFNKFHRLNLPGQIKACQVKDQFRCESLPPSKKKEKKKRKKLCCSSLEIFNWFR